MRDAGRRIATTGALALLALGAGTAQAVVTSSLTLPRPVDDVPVIGGAGLQRDRLLTSRVPGPVANREAVTVALGGDGRPAAVTVEQRLAITGTGDYQIRERGPARSVEGIGDTVPPVLKLGTVVWQGFSPGRRDLAARLTLDAGLEAPRLPLSVQLDFAGPDGRRTPLGPAGEVPGPGTVTVRLTNSTAMPVTVPLGTAEPGPAARVLQSLLEAARRPLPGRPPTAGDGLPLTVPGTASGTASLAAVAALRVTGSIRVPSTSARVSGPGTTALADGARIRGTLQGAAVFTVRTTSPGRLALDLAVAPWLDPRTLGPPPGSRSWPAWAAAAPGEAPRREATRILVAETANAARAADYTPYLDANLRGPRVTSYRYVMAAPGPSVRTVPGLRPQPAAIAAGAVAALLIAVDLGLLWRRL